MRYSVKSLKAGDEVGICYYDNIYYAKFVEMNSVNSIIIDRQGRRNIVTTGVVFKPTNEIKSLEQKVRRLKMDADSCKYIPQLAYKANSDFKHAQSRLQYLVRLNLYSV